MAPAIAPGLAVLATAAAMVPRPAPAPPHPEPAQIPHPAPTQPGMAPAIAPGLVVMATAAAMVPRAAPTRPPAPAPAPPPHPAPAQVPHPAPAQAPHPAPARPGMAPAITPEYTALAAATAAVAFIDSCPTLSPPPTAPAYFPPTGRRREFTSILLFMQGHYVSLFSFSFSIYQTILTSYTESDRS